MSAAEFLERAGVWLEYEEAQNNLILGIGSSLKGYSGAFNIPPYYITVEEGGEIVGVAFMHPPRGLITSHMPNEELARDAGIADESAFTKAQIPNLTAKERLYVWENGEIVSMAGLARETPHGFAVALVYTPPRFRRKGYAGSCVAALTQRTLDSGKRFCCLYTDLANPTSNSIYQKIGYQSICDVQDYVFE
jgi:GNAT superfamily N-acetyltransferase